MTRKPAISKTNHAEAVGNSPNFLTAGPQLAATNAYDAAQNWRHACRARIPR
ncbi:hypothetical protein [uncultured Rhodoblastus sp.]|uniref:hypothetical protein n=1 Tax=uncultured Rhodoblastus sp. TaxID=543037 RepID=UPI0026014502|nr:hypothetical protein [uncultured Rhodoblastus sp.]